MFQLLVFPQSLEREGLHGRTDLCLLWFPRAQLPSAFWNPQNLPSADFLTKLGNLEKRFLLGDVVDNPQCPLRLSSSIFCADRKRFQKVNRQWKPDSESWGPRTGLMVHLQRKSFTIQPSGLDDLQCWAPTHQPLWIETPLYVANVINYIMHEIAPFSQWRYKTLLFYAQQETQIKSTLSDRNY